MTTRTINRREALYTFGAGALASALLLLASPAQSAERHPHIRTALRELREARKELKEREKEFGGHAEKALKAVDEAIEQLDKALNFADK
jgi:septal ring factor EnvC (AmiA/AmiB activator)